ncbi:hypothetical protein [Solibacillus sp. FSL H8-0538]|uniref:hypothetical protein n=1 Tax=Solibacillus sp. FSL H8-0538 TaxID=2921400 RepID=UPI0030F91D62
MNIVIIILIFLMSIVVINSFLANSNTEYIPQNELPSVVELAFLRELRPSILEAMFSYGNRQLFTSGRIGKIVRNGQNDYYDVTLEVVGYEGPLNPPYTLIRITFRIPNDNSAKNRVIYYEQKIITSNEFKQLSAFT